VDRPHRLALAEGIFRARPTLFLEGFLCQDVREKEAVVKPGCTPVTQHDRRSAEAAKRCENQDRRAVQPQLMVQLMLHSRPRHAHRFSAEC